MQKKNIPLAKVTRPKVTGVFPRERLFRLMDTGRNCPVLWITSPPGAGKTTLVSSYIDARKLPCLWYQADEGDADVATFFYYMGMAVKKATPGKQRPLPLLTPEYLPNISLFTRRYFEKLYSRLKPPFLMVFDNYQDVPAGSGFHDMIFHGLDVIPEGIHIIAVSRTEPPPQLARLCANNKCHRIGWDEIRFTPEETRALARMKLSPPVSTLSINGGKRRSHVKARNIPSLIPGESEQEGYVGSGRQKKITDETLVRLHNKTDGWVAGLILVMESARTKDINSLLLNELTHERIFDYFANEIFEKMDKETQEFLLKTAFLRKITAHTAEKLTGCDLSGHILSNLNRNNYFTVRNFHAEPVYQYHPLFREFLFSRAGDVFSHEALFRIQRGAAALMEESGQVEDAAELLCNTKDRDGLARLIINQAPSLVAQGRHKTLAEWLDGIPVEVMERTPWLLYWLGVCRLSFNPAESHHLLEKAFELFRIRNDRTGMLLAWASGLDAFFHEFEDFAPLDRYIALWGDFLSKETTFPSSEIEIPIVSSRFILMLLRQMNHPEIEKWAERLFLLLQGCRNAGHRLQAGYHLAVYYLWTGDFAKAGILVDSLNKDIQSEAASPLYRLLGKTTQAMYAWLTGSVASCLRIVSEALRFARETGVHVWDHHLLSHGTCASLTAGDTKTAAKLLQKIESGLTHARKIDVGFYHFLSSWNALLSGDLPSAIERIEISMKAVTEVEAPFPVAVGHFWNAQTLFELGRHKEAEEHLNLVCQIGRHIKSKQVGYMSLLAEAQFALGIRTSGGEHRGNGESENQGGMDKLCLSVPEASGESEKQGLDALRKAMELGREQGYVNMFGWRPDIMSRLCVEALEAGIETEYVRNLIRKRDPIPDSPPLGCENWPWPLRICTLGRFAILRDEEPISFGGKVQHKPMELLKAIISFGGKDVPRDTVVDILWPHAEGDMARQSFDTTLHRLRRLIGNDKAISLQGEQVSLDDRYCWIDIRAFEYLYKKVEDLFKSIGETERGGKGEIADTSIPHAPPLPCTPAQAELLRLSQKAITLYSGSFLPSDTRCLWTVSTRERLRNKFHNICIILGNYLEQRGQWQKAVEHYLRAIETDDLAEEFYRRLMVCYQRLGQRAKAIEVYQRLKNIVSVTFQIGPSPGTNTIYRALLSEDDRETAG